MASQKLKKAESAWVMAPVGHTPMWHESGQASAWADL